MAERLCGYCRQPGHRRPECSTLLEERKLVLEHTPKQRLETLRALKKIGLGIGALVTLKDWYTGAETLGMIKDFNFLTRANFMEHKQVKYSKRVKLSPLIVEKDYGYRRVHIEFLSMGGGGADLRNVGLNITTLLRMIDNSSIQPDLLAERFKMENPSEVIEFDPQILVRDVQMPRRLCLTKREESHNYLTGIMPADISV